MKTTRLIGELKVAIAYTSAKSEDGVDRLLEQIASLGNGSIAVKIQADLRQVGAPSEIVKATRAAFGEHIDILVNNAGFQVTKSLMDITAQDFADTYDLNVRAVMLMSKAVLPFLRAPGRIINIGSVGARCGFKDLSLYCSSKSAVEGLTRVFAVELGAAGHTVNTVNPGPVQTDLLNGVPQEIVDMQMKSTPAQNRLGDTDDVAQIVVFLAEDRSRWITGQG